LEHDNTFASHSAAPAFRRWSEMTKKAARPLEYIMLAHEIDTLLGRVDDH